MTHHSYMKFKFRYTQIKVDWDTTKQKMSSGFHFPLISQSNIFGFGVRTSHLTG